MHHARAVIPHSRSRSHRSRLRCRSLSPRKLSVSARFPLFMLALLGQNRSYLEFGCGRCNCTCSLPPACYHAPRICIYCRISCSSRPAAATGSSLCTSSLSQPACSLPLLPLPMLLWRCSCPDSACSGHCCDFGGDCCLSR